MAQRRNGRSGRPEIEETEPFDNEKALAFDREKTRWYTWAKAHPEEAAAWATALNEADRTHLAAERAERNKATRQRRKERELANPELRERRLAFQKEWWLKTKYGLTTEDWRSMFDAQEGKCAVCQKAVKLSVDHDHSCCPGKETCGKCIRGLICRNCNTAIGLLGDDPAILRRALSYLERGPHV